MRSRYFALIAVLPALILLAGCSGDDIVYETLLNPMPLEQDTGLRYSFRVESWFGDDNYVQRGVATRRIVGQQQVDLEAGTVPATVVETEFPALAAPDIALQQTHPMKIYTERLFAADGGLAPWTSYFQKQDNDNDSAVDRIVRVASGHPAGSCTEIPRLKPHIPLPFAVGYASNNSYPIVTTPMYSNNPTLSDSQCLFNSQFRIREPILGENRVRTTLTQRVGADINFDGHIGPCTGVIKTDLTEGIGPTLQDIDLEFRLAGEMLRVHMRIVATERLQPQIRE